MSQPWENLSKIPLPSLRKLASLLGAVKKNPLSNEDDGYAFGETGASVAKELLAYVAAKEDGTLSASTALPSGDETPMAFAGIGSDDMQFIRRFKDQFVRSLGIAAPVRYGRDRKAVQGLLKGGQTLEDLTLLIPIFFSLKDKGYVFRNGTITDFCNAIAQLQVEHLKTKTSAIPVGVR